MMNNIKLGLKWFFIVSGVLIWLAILIVYGGDHKEVVYDCRLAEISPDFPPEVRNECRKLRSVKRITA